MYGKWNGVAAIVAQHPDTAAAVVAENIRAVELRDAVAAINHAADDRIAGVIRRAAVGIFLDRENQSGRRIRKDRGLAGIKWLGQMQAFVVSPAAVRAVGDDIHFFIKILPDIADVNKSSAGIN